MFLEFLTDLHKVYQKNERLQAVIDTFWSDVESNPKFPKKWFDDTYGRQAQLIHDKDPELFVTPGIFKDVDIHDLWQTASEENKDVIWKYFQFLYQYSNMLNMIPAEAIPQVDSMVSSMMDRIDLSQGLDAPDIMNAALGMLMKGS